jgi:hypothetical protein
MCDFGQLWICDNDADVSICPTTPDAMLIADCHEWDGLFSIHALNTDSDIRLTGWCDGKELGSFELKCKSQDVVSGTTRVVHAPEIMEPDGYSFPPGAYFGAGLWTIECMPHNGTKLLIKIEVRDWNSTD